MLVFWNILTNWSLLVCYFNFLKNNYFYMENVESGSTPMREVVANPERLREKKEIFKTEGLEKIHILSDFDRTLTYGSVDGLKTPSIISMLRDGKHLSGEYARKAHALYDQYHPIEVDVNISVEEKKKAMQKWWNTHNKLLVESGLSKADLEDIVERGQVKFREGVGDFLDWLAEKDIPLVIMSASGCGDAVEMFFKKIGKDYPNIHYVTNQFEWDENGMAVAAKEPIIHSLNKDETVLSDLPEIYKQVKKRKNVILLGDGLHDLDMVKGFEYDNLISVGFQNYDNDKIGDEYKKRFDLVLAGDGGFGKVNKLMRELE